VHVSRAGLTLLKGARHTDRPHVDLTEHGPVGDREFCLVDPARGRVLRTVENRGLLATEASWHGDLLTTTLPSGIVSGVPEPTGETLERDYWGRPARLETVRGPWAAAYSEHLGVEVLLARPAGPGEIVYGASVSLVTTSSLERLAEEAGDAVDGAQFRATFTLDTTGHPPHVEDGWVGHRLRLGEAEVEVRAVIPRCAVVDLDPLTGLRKVDVLAALGRYRRSGGEVVFGVDAVVTRPGRVDVAAAVERG